MVPFFSLPHYQDSELLNYLPVVPDKLITICGERDAQNMQELYKT